MGISFRYYLFPEDGSLRRIPQRIANELPFGRDERLRLQFIVGAAKNAMLAVRLLIRL